MRAVLLVSLGLSLALAGCSAQVDGAREQLDDVKTNLDEAKAALEAARQEAREARDRLERVTSLAVLREERVTLTVRAVIEGDVLRFEVTNATRSNGDVVPKANITRLPLLSLQDASGGMATACDPLTCRVSLPAGASVLAHWVDAPDHEYVIERGASRMELALAEARILATTDAGDATD